MYYFPFSILINNAAINIFLCRGDRGSELFPQSFASALLLPHPSTLVTSALHLPSLRSIKHPFLRLILGLRRWGRVAWTLFGAKQIYVLKFGSALAVDQFFAILPMSGLSSVPHNSSLKTTFISWSLRAQKPCLLLQRKKKRGSHR